jgi:ubiquinol-cytochrome c reductase cytochrome b subunit
MIAGVVILHVWALHVPGNNNPTGVEVQDVKKDTVPFHPYYTVKDGFAIVVFMILFALVVFYFPQSLGHTDNYIEANPLVTPAHIVPEWYMLPFYAILRAIDFGLGPIDAKLLGVIAMFGAIALLFVVPWLDTSKVKSLRYRPTARYFFFAFIIVGLGLGVCGAKNPDDVFMGLQMTPDRLVVEYTDVNDQAVKLSFDEYDVAAAEMKRLGVSGQPSIEKGSAIRYIHLAKFLTFCYFAYFLLVLPMLGLRETPDEEPESIHKSVMKKSKSAAPAAVPAE